MKVKDLIQQPIDIDVYDDVCEELAIAFCGTLELTDEGKEHFAEVLDYDVELNNNCAIVKIDTPDDGWKIKLKKAKEFFESAAGYCSVKDYDKWFKPYNLERAYEQHRSALKTELNCIPELSFEISESGMGLDEVIEWVEKNYPGWKYNRTEPRYKSCLMAIFEPIHGGIRWVIKEEDEPQKHGISFSDC